MHVCHYKPFVTHISHIYIYIFSSRLLDEGIFCEVSDVVATKWHWVRAQESKWHRVTNQWTTPIDIPQFPCIFRPPFVRVGRYGHEDLESVLPWLLICTWTSIPEVWLGICSVLSPYSLIASYWRNPKEWRARLSHLQWSQISLLLGRIGDHSICWVDLSLNPNVPGRLAGKQLRTLYVLCMLG